MIDSQEQMASAARHARFEPQPAAPAMTRCECAGVSFNEVARRMREEGLTLEEVPRRTGCGGTCTACLADLVRYLRSR